MLAPVLLISGAFGGMVGALLGEFAPGLGVSAGAFAVVAMAATFGAATRATFTSIIGSDLQADMLRTTVVAEVMTRNVETLPATAGVADAFERLAHGRHSAYPIVTQDGACAGIVSRTDLLVDELPEGVSLTDVAKADLVTVQPHNSVLAALEVMLDEQVDHLPVVEDGRLVGICTRSDVLRARGREFALERPEPGWLAPMFRRRRRVPARRYLVVGNQTLGNESLLREIDQRTATGRCRFHILVPASDTAADGDVERLDRAKERFREFGCEVDGEVGPEDPVQAIQAALQRAAYDEILLSTLAPGVSRWLRMDLPSRMRRSVDVQVTHVAAERAGKT